MKTRYLKLKNWLLVSVMGALGLTSCHCHKKATTERVEVQIDERGEASLMYGVPTMNYMIRGQVRDAEGRPVQDIRVNVLDQGIEATADTVYGDPKSVGEYLERTSVATDRQGRFTLQGDGRPQEQYRVLVRDTDGAENGSYKNQLLELKVDGSNLDRSEAGGWNLGTFRQEVEVRLERK